MDLSTLANLVNAFAVTAGVLFAAAQIRYYRQRRQREAMLELVRSFQSPAFTSALRRVLSLPDGADAQLARLAQLERRLAYRPVTAPGEPITEREREVLRLLQGTLSLRDIGRELYLSPNTIKTHTRALYRKLGASDRQDAVAKARELGIM